METFGLRRTQSLKSLSGVQERSWVMPAPTRWDRKSVSQLVQHYQSCADLRSTEKEQHKLQVSDSCADGRWGKLERGDSVALWGSGRTSNLSRSRSMDFLPQRESSGTRALCALFESKATQQQSSNSSPRLNSASAAGRHCPLQDWRSHSTSLKETTSQRSAKVEGGQAMNGLPESHDRSSRYSHDDKYSPPLTKGGTPTRQSRDRISTSSLVRDRSALYLSRAAAIDSTGGSTQSEIVNTPGTRAKNSKFGLPAKDVCSACLTPVYPMEKMVANKLVLHKNCFCCKHCEKKLSIHNYSSLYGEFYCVHHYQQLFKRTGNYDEGFGHKQHKDRWLKKDKGINEPGTASTAKITKTNLGTSDGSRESSAGVTVTKSNAKELGNSGADVKGKLKRSWPPEKKSPGVNPAQQTYVRNKISDIGKGSSSEHLKSDNSQLKINHSGEMKGKVKTLSSSFISGIEERSKPMNNNSAERSEEIKRRNGPTKDSNSPTVLNFSSPSRKMGVTATNRTTEEKNVAPTSKTIHNLTSNRLDAYPNKVRKSVRFSSSVDVAQYDPSSHLDTGAKGEEHSTQLTEQTEQDKVNKTRNIEDVSDKNNLSIECSKEQSESEVCLEIPESKGHRETSSMSNQETEVKLVSSQEVQQSDAAVLHGVVDKVEALLDTHSFTETFSSSEVVEKLQEESETSQVIPGNSVNLFESEDPQAPQNPAKHTTREEANLERDKNLLEKTDSANDQENGTSQKKPVARTNSLRGSAKQAEKAKAKLGSWSKGKSPLSKLFTSGGNDKKNEAKDAKKPDVKPGGGLLGRLFQSSSEKAEDVMKSAAQDGRKDKTCDDDKEQVKEAVATEMQKEFQVLPQEQEGGEHLKEKSHDAEPKNEAMSKSPELFKTSTNEMTDDRKAPEQTNDQESNLRSNGLVVTDPEKAESKDLTITVQSVSQASEELISQLTAERSGDEVLNAPFNDDILAPVASSDVQINTDESARKPNELLDEDVGGRDLCDGALLDLNRKDSSNPFGLEVSVDTPADASSLSGTALSEGAPADTFSLLDSPPTSAKNDAVLGTADRFIIPNAPTMNQDKGQTSVLSEAAPTETFILLDSPPTSAKNDTMLGPTDPLTVPDSATMNQDQNQTSALSEAAAADTFSLLDSPPTSAKNDAMLGPTDPLTVPDSATTNQDEDQTSALSKAAPTDTFNLLDSPSMSAKNDAMLGPTDPLTVPDSATMNQDQNQTSALSEAAPTDTFNLLDSSPMSAKNDTMLTLTDPIINPDSVTMNQDEDQTSALSEATSTDTLNLLDSPPTSAKNDMMLGQTDPLIVPDSATVNQDEDQTSKSQTRDQDADFDIFGSNDFLFTQSPAVPHQGGADASSTQPSAFTDDIFGVSDVFTMLPTTPATTNSLNDLLGSDTSSAAAPSAQADLFADDIFASEPQLLPVSEPSDVSLFVDSLLVSDNNSTQQTAGSDITNSSWMDDLLG